MQELKEITPQKKLKDLEDQTKLDIQIEKHKKIIKIGLAFSYQKTKKIPINKFDKKLDFIINEKEILK